MTPGLLLRPLCIPLVSRLCLRVLYGPTVSGKLSLSPPPSVTYLFVNYGQEWLWLYRRITNVNNCSKFNKTKQRLFVAAATLTYSFHMMTPAHTRALFNLVNKANWCTIFLSIYINFYMFRYDYVPIIGWNNCIYATLGTCYSVWMTV